MFTINEEACKYYVVWNDDDYVIIDEFALKDFTNPDYELLGTFETLQDAEEYFYNNNF